MCWKSYIVEQSTQRLTHIGYLDPPFKLKFYVFGVPGQNPPHIQGQHASSTHKGLSLTQIQTCCFEAMPLFKSEPSFIISSETSGCNTVKSGTADINVLFHMQEISIPDSDDILKVTFSTLPIRNFFPHGSDSFIWFSTLTFSRWIYSD